MNECTCLFINLRQSDISHYLRKGSTIWRIYKQCPVHEMRAIQPTWNAKYGWLNKTETAPDQGAVALET